jgi:hypothetical protein
MFSGVGKEENKNKKRGNRSLWKKPRECKPLSAAICKCAIRWFAK